MMKYKAVITPAEGLDISRTILKLDEYLKEYWGEEVYHIQTGESRVLRNTDLFDFDIKIEQPFDFYGSKDKTDFQYLKEHDYKLSPAKTEIFRFIVTPDYVEVYFYNSFITNERERQFYKIVENIKTALKKDLPLVRTKVIHKYLTDVMYRYRRNEGKVGFSLCPSIDGENYKSSLFIFWSDFAYLRAFIYQVYPQRWNGGEDSFDNTSWNDIRKEEWLQILNNMKSYTTNDIKLSAFYSFIINWVEEQLKWASYICIWGNL